MAWRCEVCAEERVMPLCEGCGSLRAPGEAEREGYFVFFGLPEQYALSRAALERAYLDVSKALHPDRHRGSPRQPAARRLAAFANEGYAVLRDAGRRAAYVLERRKVPPATLSPAFLETQLALREEAAQGPSPALRARVAAAIRDAEAALGARFAPPAGEPAWAEARQSLDELTYWRALARMLEAP
jgi:hypothetical protein